jgi:hypothetical protein
MTTSSNAAASVTTVMAACAQPALEQASAALVELQESQQVLVQTLAANRAELLESAAWRDARAVLDRLPEYAEKVARIKKAQAATLALAEQTERGAAALSAKMEERERERAKKRGAVRDSFASLAES